MISTSTLITVMFSLIQIPLGITLQTLDTISVIMKTMETMNSQFIAWTKLMQL